MMKKTKLINCIDSHTAGEPTRLVISGLPIIKGRNIKEKTDYFSKKLDNYRSILTGEPRGHAPMHAAIYIPSKSPEYDFGLILMSALGYLDMCGHALIGSVTSLLSNNIFMLKKSNQLIKISTCSGIISVKGNLKKNHIESITFTNQESFAIENEYKISVPNYGNISVNIAYGGLWYILVDSKNINIKIKKENLNNLIAAGKIIRDTVNSNLIKIKSKVKLPKKIPQTLFYEEINKQTGKNFVTSDELGFDRSPCGTGCCARLALMYYKGKIKKNNYYTQKSILNTSFKTKIVETSNNGRIIPEITGSAYVTSFNNIFVDPKDSIKNGFFLFS